MDQSCFNQLFDEIKRKLSYKRKIEGQEKIKKNRSNITSNQSLQSLFALFYESNEAEGRSPATLQQYQFNFDRFFLHQFDAVS